ncbi:hypothetical protein [Rufibacter latericius]|uniref:TerB family tellurite resistance protein n=1 Tax=Rufibacter latericius TaxID=2487040 RepID=A0A3M9MEW5_9BACT|nr:hypothetical protein [Rufibacter latericius]RNI23383.1 hypothetical protein EFB08_17700 [Rufibacter latericius]
MFNLFNKKQEENPLKEVFGNLTENQRMSVMNLLMTIGACDEEELSDKEMQYLNVYAKILDVKSNEKCMSYFELEEHAGIIKDLRPVTEKQKKFLVVAAWEMIVSDGRPNETELSVASSLFEEIGVSNEEFSKTIKASLKATNNLL